jgi:poly-gamma-glutamate capsule biosynthesis protein CapA/YwtB (metallophosphatase superfamily)
MIGRTIRPVPHPILQAGVLALATSIATSSQAKGQDANISVALVGQALIKSDVCATAPAAFEQARGYLKGVDVAFTNLEVAIAPLGEKLTPRGPRAVPAPPVVIDCLKSMGFNVLSLANNHAFDLQREGIAATIGEVRKRGLVHAGTGADADAAAAAGFLDTPKGKVALVAMATGAQLDPETWAAPGRPGVNYLERLPDGRPNPQHKNRILDAVRAAARESKLVIAYHHNHYWGDPVGSGLPPDREQRIERFETLPWAVDWARELIDAGASIYVAHGDPSLHGVEVYKGKLILHGLGNYIFESVGGNDRYGPLAYMSAVATAEFSNGQLVAAKFRPLILSTVKVGDAPRGAPYLAEGAEAELILHRLVDQSRRHGVSLEVDTATQTAHWRRRH